jgi:hypothetical protein
MLDLINGVSVLINLYLHKIIEDPAFIRKIINLRLYAISFLRPLSMKGSCAR